LADVIGFGLAISSLTQAAATVTTKLNFNGPAGFEHRSAFRLPVKIQRYWEQRFPGDACVYFAWGYGCWAFLQDQGWIAAMWHTWS